METHDIAGLKIMPVTQCNAMGRMFSTPAGFESRMPATWNSRRRTSDELAKYAMAELEKARAEDVANHEANGPALQNNARIAAAVKSLMEGIGMPAQWSEKDVKSRARFPKKITHSAGYLTDLGREVPVSDNFGYATTRYNQMLVEYQKYSETAAREAEQAKAAKEREQQAALDKRKADMELAGLLLRYELPIESDWYAVLEALCEKDARLNLAVAMQRCRNDWNDGCGSVLGAVRGISIQTDEDKEIVADILACCEDFEDGRVFRDTEWSYDRLFAEAADKQLSADVYLAMQRADARRYG